MPERHLRAARTHNEMALRHEKAALHWDEYGDSEHADLERRNVEIERAAARPCRPPPTEALGAHGYTVASQE